MKSAPATVAIEFNSVPFALHIPQLTMSHKGEELCHVKYGGEPIALLFSFLLPSHQSYFPCRANKV